MALTQKQKAILLYIGDTEKTKSQIVHKFNSWYYFNSSKHIGEILSRMVNTGLLIRIKKGVFKRGKGGDKQVKKRVFSENQLSFF